MGSEGSRRGELDIARAFAAFAVVTHHICQYFSHDMSFFNANFGETVIHTVEYMHLPTFMIVAGFVLSMKPPKISSLSDYRRFEAKKLCRLMLPFVSISILQAALKAVAPGYGPAVLPMEAFQLPFAPR